MDDKDQKNLFFSSEEESATENPDANPKTVEKDQSNNTKEDINTGEISEWLNDGLPGEQHRVAFEAKENEDTDTVVSLNPAAMNDGMDLFQSGEVQAAGTSSQTNSEYWNSYEDKQRKKKMTTRKRVLLIAGIVLGILILVYAAGCVFYNSHFFNRAKLNDIDVSNKSKDAVVTQLKNDESNYVLTLIKRDQTKVELKGKDFDCKYNDDGAVQKLLDTQECWKWPTGLFSETKYTGELGYNYDDAKLQKAIDALGINTGENVEPAVSAHPAWQNGKVEIVKEVYGNTVNNEKLNAVVREAIKKGEKELELTKAGAYETPKYLSDAPEVAAAKEAMEKAADSTITYLIDSDQEFLDVNTFGSWLGCDDNLTVTVDQTQCAAYLATLGEKYDTAGGDFNFTTSGGSQIVVSGGTFGWAVDEDAELVQTTADILSGQDVSRAILSTGTSSRSGAKDVGSTYVEISLGAQTMWLYVNGSCIIETPVVTGGPGHRTPTGVWKIESHGQNVTLRGSNDDGSQYASFVNYWMPFCHAEGDGIHDADGWRSSYGGDIYNYDGSHGCVNTPLSATRTIYNNTEDGCPVVIY